MKAGLIITISALERKKNVEKVYRTTVLWQVLHSTPTAVKMGRNEIECSLT